MNIKFKIAINPQSNNSGDETWGESFCAYDCIMTEGGFYPDLPYSGKQAKARRYYGQIMIEPRTVGDFGWLYCEKSHKMYKYYNDKQEVKENNSDDNNNNIHLHTGDYIRFNKLRRNNADEIGIDIEVTERITNYERDNILNSKNETLYNKKYFFQNTLFSLDEGQYIEYKNIKSDDTALDIYQIVEISERYINAFLNSGGGLVFFGIKNNKNIIGQYKISYSKKDYINTTIGNRLAHFSPPVEPHFYDIDWIKVVDNNNYVIPNCYVLCINIKRVNLQFQKRLEFKTSQGLVYKRRLSDTNIDCNSSLIRIGKPTKEQELLSKLSSAKTLNLLSKIQINNNNYNTFLSKNELKRQNRLNDPNYSSNDMINNNVLDNKSGLSNTFKDYTYQINNQQGKLIDPYGISGNNIMNNNNNNNNGVLIQILNMLKQNLNNNNGLNLNNNNNINVNSLNTLNPLNTGLKVKKKDIVKVSNTDNASQLMNKNSILEPDKDENGLIVLEDKSKYKAVALELSQKLQWDTPTETSSKNEVEGLYTGMVQIGPSGKKKTGSGTGKKQKDALFEGYRKALGQLPHRTAISKLLLKWCPNFDNTENIDISVTTITGNQVLKHPKSIIMEYSTKNNIKPPKTQYKEDNSNPDRKIWYATVTWWGAEITRSNAKKKKAEEEAYTTLLNQYIQKMS